VADLQPRIRASEGGVGRGDARRRWRRSRDGGERWFHERTGAYPAAISSVWPDYHPGVIGVERYRYEPSGKAYNLPQAKWKRFLFD
jgi:hypothetical protein